MDVKQKKMDTNIGKAIIGTFLILLGLLGIFFALALFFLLETLDLSTRIIISVAAGFIPLLFLLFWLKLSLPFVFKKSKDSTKSSTKLVIGMILILLGFPGVMFAIAIIFLGEAEMFVQLLVGGALLVPPLILLLIGLKVALPYFLPLVENIIGIDSEQTIKSNNEREKIKPVSVKYPRVESGSEKLERGDYDHSYIESDLWIR